MPSPPPFGSCLGVDSRSSVDRLILTPGFSTLFFSSSLAPGLSVVFLSSSLASPRRADDEPRGLDRSRWKGARGQRGQRHYSHVDRPSLQHSSHITPQLQSHMLIIFSHNQSPKKHQGTQLKAPISDHPLDITVNKKNGLTRKDVPDSVTVHSCAHFKFVSMWPKSNCCSPLLGHEVHLRHNLVTIRPSVATAFDF